MRESEASCLDFQDFPQELPNDFGRFDNDDAHPKFLLYRRLIQAQPHPTSRDATRNRSSPVGKMAQMKRMRQPEIAA